MDSRKYASALADAKYVSKFWMFSCAGLLIANILLAGFVLNAETVEKTIIVPPSMDKPFSVRGNDLSPDYVEQMAKYFCHLLLTYQSANAASQFESVLRYVAPQAYGAMKAQLSTEADKIVRNQLSSVFYPMGVRINDKVAIMEGELVGIVGQQIVSRDMKFFEIRFLYENGSLYIDSFKEIPNPEASQPNGNEERNATAQ